MPNKYDITEDLNQVLSMAKYYLSELGEIYWFKFEKEKEPGKATRLEADYAEVHKIITALQDLQNTIKPEIDKV